MILEFNSLIKDRNKYNALRHFVKSFSFFVTLHHGADFAIVVTATTAEKTRNITEKSNKWKWGCIRA